MVRRNRKPSRPKRRVPRSISNNEIILHRRSVGSVAKTASDTGYAYNLNLSDFNASDILSLFSEYKIISMKVTHLLVTSPNAVASFPRLHIAPRGFSVTNPISRAEVLQYNGLSEFQFGPTAIRHTRRFVPYVWTDVVTTASGTGKRVDRSPWIATDSDTVRHNYAVTWIDRYNTTTDNTHTIELLIDVVLAVRGPR